MLIDSDFIRHGFAPSQRVVPNNKCWYRAQGFIHINVERLRKGMQKVDYYLDNEYIDSEIMWSPEQLRLFLIKNGIIVQNIIPNVRKNDT